MELDYYDIDYDRLREDLEDYYESAYFMVSPLALADLSEVEEASDGQLITIARKNRVDLTKYLKTNRR